MITITSGGQADAINRTVAMRDFLATRPACPGCGADAVMRSRLHVDFGCGAGFFAHGEAIEAKRPCPAASELAAKLWTIQAGGAVHG